MEGQTEYVASFPGVHFVEWGRVTQAMLHQSVACVFVPGNSKHYGKHDKDPEHPGLCFCQSFLYHDTPAEMKRKQGYLMDESEIQLGDAVPKVNEKAEVELTFTRVSESGAEYAENKWWLCMVVYVGEGCIGVVPPGYSMDEFASQEGFETVQDDAGVTSFRLSPDSPRLNRSGKRKTAIQVGQAPFGCVWYGKWVEQVEVAESKGQRAIVVYKKGLKGKRWPGDSGGLGYSQMKEVAFLQSHYQKYDEGHRAFDKTAGFKEISAREFEEANALNRAQIYASATTALLLESGKAWGGKYRGQEQKWFLLRFHGTDGDVNIATDHPEFSAWKWLPKDQLVDNIVPFKRAVYEQVLAELGVKL